MQLSFYSAYKSLNHRVNFGQFKRCTDIEKNPGPSVYVDATKTIHAPSQRNVAVFGENAGQQCVAVSLRALVYSKITGGPSWIWEYVRLRNFQNGRHYKGFVSPPVLSGL